MNPFDRAQGKVIECTREQDVLDALAARAGNWSDELRAHVAGCAICADIVTVALPLLDEHHATVEGAHLPSSGIVWWRATLRARQEAAQAATRPITVVQGVALASAAALFVALLGAAAPTLFGWFGKFLTLPQVELSSLIPTTGTGMLLVGACVVCLLLGPLAVYFATGDE